MQEINYRQEFPLFISFYYKNEKGELQPFGFPPFNFKLIFWTTSRNENFEASCNYVNGEPKYINCRRIDDKLVVIFDRHKLNPGNLHSEFVMETPSNLYPDGLRRDVVLIHSEVKLIHGPTPAPTRAEITAILPYIVGKDGRDFTYEDFTQEQLEELTDKVAEKTLENVDGKIEEAIKDMGGLEEKIDEAVEKKIGGDLTDIDFSEMFQ